MSKQTKQYVIIQSQRTIQVTCGLQLKDVTNPDAHVPDRLKISSLWPTASILITAGQHTYPAEIATWKTVQALQRDGALTVGSYIDEPLSSDDAAKVAQTKEELTRALEQIEAATNKEVKDIKLADIAGE